MWASASNSAAESKRGLRFWGWALVVMLATGCAPEPVGGAVSPTPPDGVLSRAEFVKVLAEVQLVEAASDLRIHRNDNERERLSEAYLDIWQRTGVAAATFDSSYTWRWSHPEAMKEIWRDVVDELNTMDAKKGGTQGRSNSPSASPMDLRNRTNAGDTSPPQKQ